MSLKPFFRASIAVLSLAIPAIAQQKTVSGPSPASGDIAAASPQPAAISGTVMDANGDIIPGASIVVRDSNPADENAASANANGGFSFNNLKPGMPYHVTIGANGFASWTSPAIVLDPGQYLILTDARLALAGKTTSVTVYGSQEQLAVQQVNSEIQQRVLGFIPNFYVVYAENPAPLTAKLKYRLAIKTLTDPVTLAGLVLNAGIYQAARYPDYQEGTVGFGERLGSTFAGNYTGVLVGDAVLPSLLHQDPRYYYKGRGSIRSRILHALEYPIITRGDNGKRQVNFSGIGGDLASGFVANAYYPQQDRGARLAVNSALIGAGGRVANGLVQEFVLQRFTRAGKSREE